MPAGVARTYGVLLRLTEAGHPEIDPAFWSTGPDAVAHLRSTAIRDAGDNGMALLIYADGLPDTIDVYVIGTAVVVRSAPLPAAELFSDAPARVAKFSLHLETP